MDTVLATLGNPIMIIPYNQTTQKGGRALPPVPPRYRGNFPLVGVRVDSLGWSNTGKNYAAVELNLLRIQLYK